MMQIFIENISNIVLHSLSKYMYIYLCLICFATSTFLLLFLFITYKINKNRHLWQYLWLLLRCSFYVCLVHVFMLNHHHSSTSYVPLLNELRVCTFDRNAKFLNSLKQLLKLAYKELLFIIEVGNFRLLKNA